ncbi:Uncharacterised protein [Mycobacteroides abscessus subsp. abscessus]|nr:Uncharacterised protein [Mycobacteroides abscessus subsp. abscessus]
MGLGARVAACPSTFMASLSRIAASPLSSSDCGAVVTRPVASVTNFFSSTGSCGWISSCRPNSSSVRFWSGIVAASAAVT